MRWLGSSDEMASMALAISEAGNGYDPLAELLVSSSPQARGTP
jgi:hypothetical protein